MIKEEHHIFQGMKRDNHQINQKSEFLWDARNIRITNREDNTLFSITNEKGTSEPLITFENLYVGHCVLGKYLVVFTSTEDTEDSYIYRVEKDGDSFKTIILFRGNIGINPNNPIEAIGCYETDLVQKVYWVDGKNQPRVINIAKPELRLLKWCIVDGVNLSGNPFFCTTDRDVDRELHATIPNGLYDAGSFDFVRDLALKEIVNVHKIYGQGMFSPGTIQYAFSYHNKYEQESNICYTTPLYYISPEERGGDPEEKVACSFQIQIIYPDRNFEYVRLYSIHRTSIDAEPTVKILEDIAIDQDPTPPNPNIVYTDTGTTGSVIEPMQLLYVGGESIVANCIEQKDNTLFLGNIEQKGGEDFKEIEKLLLYDWALDDWTINSNNFIPSTKSVYYDYIPDLSNGYSGAFKYNEIYRLGIQVQYSNGKWSEPIHLTDNTLTDFPIWDTYPEKVSKAVEINDSGSNPELEGKSLFKVLAEKKVKKIRTCVVFPRTYERNILCQGILCPTVYGVSGRRNGTLYAMSSWFFRPATKFTTLNESESTIYKGAAIQYRHNQSLFTGANRGAEIQSMQEGAYYLSDVTTDNINKYDSHFFVDENIVTFHSPDIEFDSNIINSNYEGVTLNIIGVAKLGAISGDIDIRTKSATFEPNTAGFIHNYIGYKTNNKKNKEDKEDKEYINGGLIANPFYQDFPVSKDFTSAGSARYWMVYPWHRSGSLNNDTNRPTDKGTRSAVLFKKKLSNLKFFDINKSIVPMVYKISTPQVFNSNELSLIKLSPSYLNEEVNYLGNIDTLVSSKNPYPLYSSEHFDDAITAITDDKAITESSEPVRIKYKSTPHLVFSLGDEYNKITLLPRLSSMTDIQNGNFTFPTWQSRSENTKGKYDYLVCWCSESDYLIHAKGEPQKNEIGSILIGKWATLPSEKVTYAFCKAIATSDTGNLWQFLGPEYNGKIVKFAANYTKKPWYEGYPFGTTSEDWSGSTYIGKDRYFRLNIQKEGTVNPLNTITDVTAEIESSPSKSITYTLEQKTFEDNTNKEGYPYLLIGELVRNNVANKFGGKSEEALRQNLWIPAGRAVSLEEAVEGGRRLIVPFEYGDTWYSRYDCLKTYPFTQEDENSVIEIGSFMCETRVNIDGRYDKNRGQLSNLSMTPQNFNLLNEVYSQKDNFFPHRKLDKDFYNQHIFNNQITWSKLKNAGEDVDTWTNITLANTLDLNGDKGAVTAIKTLNDNLLCFQEKAVNQLLFNTREQIPVSDGVPIEITNGYKMSGSRILNDTIGCKNKWSIINTPSALYFVDSNSDSIYSFSDQLSNLSESKGMNWWLKENPTDIIWNPLEATNLNGIRSFYDVKYGDIYFTPGYIVDKDNQPDALCYSERVQQFTSLMSYGGTQAMFNFDDNFYSLKDDNGTLKLYENNVGNYNNFFGEDKGWSLSFISNDNATYTKVFNNIELRTDHYTVNSTKPLNTCPINYIKVMNEYQNGEATVNSKNMRKKFRVWRGDIPRHENTLQRIRNPWSMITLGWNPELSEDKNNKAVIHDVSVKYTI